MMSTPTDVSNDVYPCATPRLCQEGPARSARTRATDSTWSIAALSISLLLLSSCSKEPAAKEPIVPVQVAQVEKATIQHVVAAQAVLFPLAQSAIVPKISAPVRTFLVTRGSRVRQGELLAVL